MLKVHTAESAIEIAHLRNLLESEGIACEVRNDLLSGVIGRIPFVECWPQLWVREPGQELRARGLIRAALDSRSAAGDAWTCPRCGERIEPQFSECWNCSQPAEAAPGEK